MKHAATLQMESVSESLLFGWPHILVPHADSFDSMTEMKANEQSLLALCQVHLLGIYAQRMAHSARPAVSHLFASEIYQTLPCAALRFSLC